MVEIYLGCLGFRGEMGYPKNTNVVTQNTSGEEEESAAIIADAGSHECNGEETTVEGLIIQLSQGSFNHDGWGEIWVGKADSFGKKRHRFELKEPPRHPPTRVEYQDQTDICGSKLCYSHFKTYNSNIK